MCFHRTTDSPWFARGRRSAIGALTLLAAIGLSSASSPETKRPNVLILTIDTLRVDRLSSYGYDRATSPNLDRLIEAGVRFTQARTIEPLTGPALCSMVTSSYPHQHGASRNGLRMREGLDSISKLARADGYRTSAFVGNWTLKNKLTGLGEHFESYRAILKRKRYFGLANGEATADDLTAAAGDWLGDHVESDDPRPFLLWVHYVEPHAPYRLHKSYLERLGLPTKGKHPPEDRYDTEIADVDRAVGELLGRLTALELEDDTIVVFTSDHGESLGEHNYWGHGRNLYETTLHVPMSVTWPGKIEPGDIDAPALIIDIGPTIAGLAGMDAPASFAGYDWTPTLRDSAIPVPGRLTHYQAHKGAVISDHDSELARRDGLLEVAILQAGKKEIFRVKNGHHWRFDLTADPRELRNLVGPAGDPSELLDGWSEVVTTGLHNLDDEVPAPLDEESIEQLRALGYAD